MHSNKWRICHIYTDSVFCEILPLLLSSSHFWHPSSSEDDSCKCPSIALCHQDLFLNDSPSLQPDCCPFHFVLIAPKANLMSVHSKRPDVFRLLFVSSAEIWKVTIFSGNYHHYLFCVHVRGWTLPIHVGWMSFILSVLVASWENSQHRATNSPFCCNPYYSSISQISPPSSVFFTLSNFTRNDLRKQNQGCITQVQTWNFLSIITDLSWTCWYFHLDLSRSWPLVSPNILGGLDWDQLSLKNIYFYFFLSNSSPLIMWACSENRHCFFLLKRFWFCLS